MDSKKIKNELEKELFDFLKKNFPKLANRADPENIHLLYVSSVEKYNAVELTFLTRGLVLSTIVTDRLDDDLIELANILNANGLERIEYIYESKGVHLAVATIDCFYILIIIFDRSNNSKNFDDELEWYRIGDTLIYVPKKDRSENSVFESHEDIELATFDACDYPKLVGNLERFFALLEEDEKLRKEMIGGVLNYLRSLIK